MKPLNEFQAICRTKGTNAMNAKYTKPKCINHSNEVQSWLKGKTAKKNGENPVQDLADAETRLDAWLI